MSPPTFDRAGWVTIHDALCVAQTAMLRDLENAPIARKPYLAELLAEITEVHKTVAEYLQGRGEYEYRDPVEFFIGNGVWVRGTYVAPDPSEDGWSILMRGGTPSSVRDDSIRKPAECPSEATK